MDPVLFEIYLKEKTNLADSSIQEYRDTIKRFLISNPDLEDSDSYNEYLLNKSFKRRNYMIYYALVKFIEYKIIDSKIKNIILKKMQKPIQKSGSIFNRKYLSVDDIIKVINNIQNKKHKTIALLSMITGLRAGDILRIKFEDINIEEEEDKPVMILNVIAKRNKRFNVHIYDDTAQKLVLEYLLFDSNNMHDDYCFINNKFRTEKWRDKNNFTYLRKTNYILYWRDLKDALVRTGISHKSFATHDFKRCFARRVWDKYKDLHVLKNMLHHERVETSLRYLEHSGLNTKTYYKEMQEY